MFLYRLAGPNNMIYYDDPKASTPNKSNHPSKSLPSDVAGTLNYSSKIGSVRPISLSPAPQHNINVGASYDPNHYVIQANQASWAGDPIPVKLLEEQKVNGGEPAIKGLKGNVNHDVINELSLAGVDYMQGNIFNQLFVQGGL